MKQGSSGSGGDDSSAAGPPGASGAPVESGGASAEVPSSPLEQSFVGSLPSYSRVLRLTGSQFEHAAIDILGLPKGTDLKSGLDGPREFAGAFTNNERLLNMDEARTRAFEEAAEKAAQLATGSADALSRLYAGTDAAGFIRTLGRKAFRRPLTPEEEARFAVIFARGEELYGSGFAHGAALVIRALLQSPYFLYRTELGPADMPLSGYEIASKLSFWLQGTTPSDALLDAAAANSLASPSAVLDVASAMLETPAATAVMGDFHAQLYWVAPYQRQYLRTTPALTDALRAESQQASLRFFDRLFEGDQGVTDIFTSTRGFVGPELSRIYGQAPAAALEERELGPERLGFFMQAPWLMVPGADGEPNSTFRGVNLVTQALCARVGMVESVPLPPLAPGQTNRQRVTYHTQSCGAVCHGIYDTVGFAFEGFDQLGAARDTDNGLPVDTSGSLTLPSGPISFANARELMTKLANVDQVYSCYAQGLAGYALQRDIVQEDMPLLQELSETARTGSLKAIAKALVQSPAYRVRAKDLP